jgi:hypothetical protein
MKYGVMAAINSISAVDVRADKISGTLICAKRVGLVCRCMRAEHGLLVQIVRIGATPANMICGETQGVKVLTDCHSGEQVVVVFEVRKPRLNQLTGYGEGVVFLKV